MSPCVLQEVESARLALASEKLSHQAEMNSMQRQISELQAARERDVAALQVRVGPHILYKGAISQHSVPALAIAHSCNGGVLHQLCSYSHKATSCASRGMVMIVCLNSVFHCACRLALTPC
jgi:hypothetical protein